MEIAFAIVLGIVVGSFLNVVGLRIPIGESVTKPARSYCPHCKQTLTGRDLIPVFSYLLSFGKCRHCNDAISPIYPIMESITAVSYALVVWKYGLTLEALVVAFILSVFMAITVSDLKYQLIPDRIMLPSIFISFLAMGWIKSNWLDESIGLAAGALLVTAVILISRGGMGGGDIRLNSLIGLLLGWKLMLVSFMIACILGSFIGLVLIIAKKATRKTRIPFGPYLVAAAVATLFWGQTLFDSYLNWVLGGTA